MSSEEVSGMTDANLVVAIARWRREALAEAYGRRGGKVFGLAYREVACLLGEPEGTVKSRIRSGLRRLRLPLTQAGLVRT